MTVNRPGLLIKDGARAEVAVRQPGVKSSRRYLFIIQGKEHHPHLDRRKRASDAGDGRCHCRFLRRAQAAFAEATKCQPQLVCFTPTLVYKHKRQQQQKS